MAIGGGGLRGAQANINVTPLIDVLLVLLVIFMMVTPLLVKAVPADLPKKSDRPIPERYSESQLVLTITEDRRYLLNREEAGPFEIVTRLREAFGRRGGKRVIFVNAHDSLVYGEVVRAIDICIDAGAETVGIVTGDVMLSDSRGARGLPGESASSR